MSHANARLTTAGQLLLVNRIEAGTTDAELSRQMGLSRGTAAKHGLGGALSVRQVFGIFRPVASFA